MVPSEARNPNGPTPARKNPGLTLKCKGDLTGLWQAEQLPWLVPRDGQRRGSRQEAAQRYPAPPASYKGTRCALLTTDTVPWLHLWPLEPSLHPSSMSTLGRHACSFQGCAFTTTGIKSHSRPRAAFWPTITLQDRKEEGTLIRLESLETASTPLSQPLELAPQHPARPVPEGASCPSTRGRSGATQPALGTSCFQTKVTAARGTEEEDREPPRVLPEEIGAQQPPVASEAAAAQGPSSPPRATGDGSLWSCLCASCSTHAAGGQRVN